MSRSLYQKTLLQEVCLLSVIVTCPETLILGAGAKKTTANVRRILMSQKTFANHLADEEAAIAQQQQAGHLASLPRVPTLKPSRSTTDMKQSLKSLPYPRPEKSSQGADVTMGGVETIVAKDPLDNEPLLKVSVPPIPSEREIEALLSAPPLFYNAARSAPPPPHMPTRHFCEICGYWGTVKCMKCGARVCGLACKGTHDDGRCLKFYA